MAQSKAAVKEMGPYVVRSLMIWIDNPEMRLNDLQARRPRFHTRTRKLIADLCLDHEVMNFSRHGRRRES